MHNDWKSRYACCHVAAQLNMKVLSSGLCTPIGLGFRCKVDIGRPYASSTTTCPADTLLLAKYMYIPIATSSTDNS